MPKETFRRPIERRQGRPKRNTITQILEIMQDRADVEFNGNLPDNLLIVFSDLEIDDKRTFLRRSLEALWEKQIEYAEKGLSEVVLQAPIEADADSGQPPVSEVRINPVEVKTERESINNTSADEQRKLRKWLVNVILGFMFIMFIVTILFTSLYGENDINAIFEAGKSLNSLFDMLFKADK